MPGSRRDDTLQAADVATLCDRLFAGPLAPWAGSLTFRDLPDAVDAADLADKGLFDDLVARFGQDHPGADRHAVVSFWSQYYFSRLTVVLTSFCLAADRALPLDFGSLRIGFCPQKGTPLCFQLRCGGPVREPETLVKALYEEQVAVMVAQFKRHSGLSARLFWENAGSYGMWILGEILRTRPDGAAAAGSLLRDGQWPRAGCAMLTPLKGAAQDGRPLARRVCCLRHRLPGVGRCPGTCPLPEPDEAAPTGV